METAVIDGMTYGDIPEVLEIERLSFATPWSEEAFKSEVTQNICARYIVIRQDGRIAGYGGMWIIVDEGHITNIAVHPDFRGRHLGDLIMDGLIGIASDEGINSLTLEVRKSNCVAQNLYKKYGFEVAGIRPRYYADNNEDALIMWKKGIKSIV